MTFRETYLNGFSRDKWQYPFLLALGLHLLALLLIVVLPSLLQKKHQLPETYSVDLIHIAEPAVTLPTPEPTTAPTPPSESAPVPIPIAPTSQKTVFVPEALAPAPPPPAAQPATPISLAPSKRKIKNKIPPQNVTQQPDPQQEKRRLTRIREAEQAEQRALAEANAATDSALEALKQMLHLSSAADTPRPSSAPARSGSQLGVVETQYYATIAAHLHGYWMLPAIKTWNPALTTVMVIQINSDGRITKMLVEQSSGDSFFDQFVKRTLDQANPLPMIPPAMKRQSWEIGLRFNPGGIQ
ncbi:MAG: TonB C-terminal domain-containing protein [Desulfobulbaceae bacterium]|uniref:TonB C-terminal domain-containing protein n=1 Tax=Candidatus Desulfatifera sulfidica TaxID=2841691 RepID=A0A8J6N7S6_9BACT|nr:TonB C-terminal domain-containing protein [Candidatus Desulfatifera sulfidica]